MNTPREDHSRATPYKPQHDPLQPMQPSAVAAGLLVGLCGGLIAIIPAIVKWLENLMSR